MRQLYGKSFSLFRRQQAGFWFACLLSFWLLGGQKSYGQTEILISGEYDNQLLTKILYDWEDRYQVYFSYEHKTVEKKRATVNLNRVPLDQALEKLFEGSGLLYEIRDQRFVFIQPPEPKARLCGWIKDSLTQTPIPYVRVWLPGLRKGTLTQTDGSFVIEGPFKGEDSLFLSHIGYGVSSLPLRSQVKQGCAVISLTPKAVEVEEVRISEYLTDGISYSGWAIHLNPDRVSALPGLTEPDVYRMAEVLPGLSNPDETATGMSLRGGTPDQTLIEYNDVPLFHTGHFFDMLSGINPYGVKSASVYRSGYGAAQNGHVSGLLSLSQGDSLLKKGEYGASLNLTHVGMDIAQPLLGRRAALFLSARTSIMDLGGYSPSVFEVFQQRVFQGSRIWDTREEDQIRAEDIRFQDLSLRFLWEPNSRHRLALSGMQTGDFFNLEARVADQAITSLDVLEKFQRSASLRWDWRVTDRYQISNRLSGVSYASSYANAWEWIDEGRRLYEEASRNNEVQDIRFTSRHQYAVSPRFRLEGGYESIWQKTNYTVNFSHPWGEEEYKLIPQATISSLFFTQQAEIGKNLSLELGMRAMYMRVLQDLRWGPRLHLRWRLSPNLKLRLQGGRYHQYSFQLVEWDIDIYELNPAVWMVAGGSGLPPLSATQWSIGGMWDRKDWLIDVEVYWKKLDQLAAVSTGIQQLSPGVLPESVFEWDDGTADIRGLDILLKKRWKNQRSWVSYSLGRVLYDFPEVSDQPFLAPQDIRHLLKFTHLAQWKRFEMALGWTFHTGKPYTPIIGKSVTQIETPPDEETQEVEEYQFVDPLFDEINSATLRPYHRWDISLMYSHQPKRIPLKVKLGMSAINVLDRQNQLNRQFVRQYYDREVPIDDLFAQELEKELLFFLPNLLIRLEW